jgi:hypothetical protein
MGEATEWELTNLTSNQAYEAPNGMIFQVAVGDDDDDDDDDDD